MMLAELTPFVTIKFVSYSYLGGVSRTCWQAYSSRGNVCFVPLASVSWSIRIRASRKPVFHGNRNRVTRSSGWAIVVLVFRSRHRCRHGQEEDNYFLFDVCGL